MLMTVLRRADQRLGGHAAHVHTGSANRPFVYHQNARAQIRRAARGGEGRRTPAEDREVERSVSAVAR